MARRPKPPNQRKRLKRGLRDVRPGRPIADLALPTIDALFEQSAARLDQAPPDGGREVAFAGRSNAGKSSVLNRLTNRRGLARTSRTPGRTQLLNFFRVGDGAEGDPDAAVARLVDLPGYGYAKTDHATRDTWKIHIEDYLARRQALVGMVLVMDIRHPFTEFDTHLLGWASGIAMPTLVLLNKADKLSRGASLGVLESAQAHLAAQPNVRPICFSALRGYGAPDALAQLREWLLLPQVPGEDTDAPTADDADDPAH